MFADFESKIENLNLMAESIWRTEMLKIFRFQRNTVLKSFQDRFKNPPISVKCSIKGFSGMLNSNLKDPKKEVIFARFLDRQFLDCVPNDILQLQRSFKLR